MKHSFGKQVGGRLCLDFVNTVQGRVRGSRRGRDFADRVIGERVTSYDALAAWAARAGALTAREASGLARHAAARPVEAAAVLQRGIALREAMYRVFKAAIEEWRPPPGDLERLTREIQIARSHEHLVATQAHFEWRWDGSQQALDRLLWPIVRSAEELLTSPDRERVGQCPGVECGWLFLDTSRSRRRQWCDMADCGNFAKVRRFRAKRRIGRANRRH